MSGESANARRKVNRVTFEKGVRPSLSFLLGGNGTRPAGGSRLRNVQIARPNGVHPSANQKAKQKATAPVQQLDGPLINLLD